MELLINCALYSNKWLLIGKDIPLSWYMVSYQSLIFTNALQIALTYITSFYIELNSEKINFMIITLFNTAALVTLLSSIRTVYYDDFAFMHSSMMYNKSITITRFESIIKTKSMENWIGVINIFSSILRLIALLNYNFIFNADEELLNLQQFSYEGSWKKVGVKCLLSFYDLVWFIILEMYSTLSLYCFIYMSVVASLYILIKVGMLVLSLKHDKGLIFVLSIFQPKYSNDQTKTLNSMNKIYTDLRKNSYSFYTAERNNSNKSLCSIPSSEKKMN